MVQQFTALLARNLRLNRVSLWTPNDEGGLELKALVDAELNGHGVESSPDAHDKRIQQVAENRLPLIENATAQTPAHRDPSGCSDTKGGSFAGLPLIVQDRLVAVVGLYSRSPISPRTLTLADCAAKVAALGILQRQTEEELRKALEQLRQAQKLEMLGKLAAGLVHDFSNLMSVVTGYSELVLKAIDEQHPLREDVEGIRRAGQKAGALTRRLLAFARHRPLQPEVVDLNAIVADLAPLLRRIIPENIEMVILPKSCPAYVRADTGQIEQVIMNLVLNARDAMPSGGQLTIETAVVNLDNTEADYLGASTGSQVSLIVTDTGCGIDRDLLPHIFDPFFTTKEAGKGTGLGLATVKEIVQQWAGNIQVSSHPGQGTRFKVVFPQAGASAEVVERIGGHRTATQAPGTVLLVEDEEALRGFVRNLLLNHGYVVLETGDANEAAELFHQHKHQINVLVTDVIMPKMSGIKLAERLSQESTGLKVLFMTGYPDCLVTNPGQFEAGVAFIQKPFTGDDLIDCVQSLSDGSSADQPDHPPAEHVVGAA